MIEHAGTLNSRRDHDWKAGAGEGGARPGPIVKWVGGKTRLLSQLSAFWPDEEVRARNYLEAFVGGGAVFFSRAAERPSPAILGDVNADLIALYRIVRDAPDRLISALRQLLATPHSPDIYYLRRAWFNRNRVRGAQNLCPHRAAVFLYLNRRCFNGLWRENSRGEFNVPVGRYSDNSAILDEEALHTASRTLRRAKLLHTDFAETCSLATSGDFVYLDPPYLPESSKEFTSYAGRFTYEDHCRLAEVFRDLDRRGCLVMLSNRYSRRVAALYPEYRHGVVMAPRSINRDGAGRVPVPEYVIRNY